MRREPKQIRSRQTVEAVLDAVIRILKKQGIRGVTTNRIADIAGVSIGSVYQYFPDKRAIFAALHDRHVEEIARLVESTLVAHADGSFEDLVRAMIEVLIDAHGSDPELHHLLMSQAPNGDGTQNLEKRLRNAFRLALASRKPAVSASRLEKILFVLPRMVETLAHGAAHDRPPRLSVAAAKEEAVRAVLAYLRS